MRKRIHRQLVGIAVLAIMATLLLVSFVFYNLFQKQVMEDLKSYTIILSKIEESSDTLLRDYVPRKDDIRITLINAEGEVTFDTNIKQLGELDNNSDRPEIIQAIEEGTGQSVRHSSTLDKNTCYYATRLQNGSVLRVSREVDSLWSVFKSTLSI